jgi:hypothetical protein
LHKNLLYNLEENWHKYFILTRNSILDFGNELFRIYNPTETDYTSSGGV